MFTIYTYYEVGCPKKEVQYAHRLGPYEVSQDQCDTALEICNQITQLFLLKPEESWSRGRKTLYEAVEGLKDKEPAVGDTVRSNLSSAMPVTASRVSIPLKAAGLDPYDYLCPERKKIHRELDTLVVDRDAWPSIPKPCLMVSSARNNFSGIYFSRTVCVLLFPRRRSQPQKPVENF